MARPLKPRTFKAKDFMKMMSGQIRTVVVKDISSEFGQKNLDSPARRRMAEAINEGIYNRYQPTMYERRYDNDGLADQKNIKIVFSFPKTWHESNGVNRDYLFKVRIGNIARRVPLSSLSASEWAMTATGGALSISDTEIRKTNALDLLYYWKDAGLVPNIFHSQSYSIWGAPGKFNERFHRKYFNEGRLHRVFGSRLARQFQKDVKIKIK